MSVSYSIPVVFATSCTAYSLQKYRLISSMLAELLPEEIILGIEIVGLITV